MGEYVKKYHGAKVLIHYGGGSVIRTGLLERIKKSLDQEGIAHIELGGVVPNPHLSKVYEGIELCRKEKVDFLLAVGGGSMIVGSVLTIAAAGSEMSNSCVITKEENNEKRAYDDDFARPKFAIMDPE